jgi:hypothetical protein
MLNTRLTNPRTPAGTIFLVLTNRIAKTAVKARAVPSASVMFDFCEFHVGEKSQHRIKISCKYKKQRAGSEHWLTLNATASMMLAMVDDMMDGLLPVLIPGQSKKIFE